MKSRFFTFCIICFVFTSYGQSCPKLTKRGAFFGFKDAKNEWIVPPHFIWIEEPYSTNMLVKDGSNKIGLINEKGDFLIKCTYDKLEKLKKNYKFQLFHGSYLASKNELWGLVDTLGQAIIPVEFEIGKWLDSSTLFFNRRGKQIVINDSGKILLESDFEYAELAFSQNLNKWFMRAIKNGKMGVVDLEMNEIIPFEYMSTVVWPNDRIKRLHFDGSCSLTDMDGKEILAPKFKSIEFEAYNFFKVTESNSGKSGFVDTSGIIRLPLEFSSCDVVSNGVLGIGHFFKAARTENVALFDHNGKQLTDFIYSDLSCQPDAPKLFFAQNTDGKFIILDSLGFPKSMPPVDWINANFTAIAIRNGNLCGLVTLDGDFVTPIKYELTDGYLSKKEILLLNDQFKLKPPVSIIGKATLESQQYYITNDGQEFAKNKD